MQALIDNDVYAKIAKYGLLAGFDQLLMRKGYARPHGRLAAAPFKLAVWGKKAGRGWSDQQKCQDLAQFFRNHTTTVTGTSEAALESLNVPFFDTGEIKLLARAIDDSNSHILTGDKNALRALAGSPSLSPYAAQIAGRVVHFEMTVDALCGSLSYGVVRSAILAAPGTDISLDNIFAHSDSSSGMDALHRSIRRLRSETNGLLMGSF